MGENGNDFTGTETMSFPHTANAKQVVQLADRWH